ncbi:MAG: Flp family type IVb pilin [Pseudomonadota bacterium]
MQKLFRKWFGVESETDVVDAVDTLEHIDSDDEKGATAIEYALIAALIAVTIIGAVTALGEDIEDSFEEISVQLTTA